jgi:hypothetical protein
MIAKTKLLDERAEFGGMDQFRENTDDFELFSKKLYSEMLISCFKKVKFRKAELVMN